MFGLFVAISLFEIVTGVPKVLQLMNDPDARAPGDYRFDPLGLGGSADLQEREISNGRLAMMAFSGILTQDVLTGGKGFPYLQRRRRFHPAARGDQPDRRVRLLLDGHCQRLPVGATYCVSCTHLASV